MTVKVWDSTKNSIEEAFDLPEGSYCADFGILKQQSVSAEHVLEAATAIKESELKVVAISQAGLIVRAQEKGVAFDWASKLVLG